MEVTTWIELLKALAAPIVAVAAISVSHQQVEINRTKFRAEMFEKRIDVYEKVRELLRQFSREGQLTIDDLATYRAGTAHAVFTCNATVVSYLSELDRQAAALIRAQHMRQLILEGRSPRSLLDIDDRIDDLHKWLMDQDKRAIAKFADMLLIERPTATLKAKIRRRARRIKQNLPFGLSRFL